MQNRLNILSSRGLCSLTLITIFTLPFGVEAMAQDWRKPDKSPLDVSYLKKSRGEAPIARVIYSRPQKKGRVIFGELVQYNQLWRTGANEATEITFYQDVIVAGKAVKAGSYALFTIPNKDQWTIVLSSKLHQWGSYGHKESDEVLRVSVPASQVKDTIEYFSVTFEFKDQKAHLYLGWDQTVVAIPIGGAFIKG